MWVLNSCDKNMWWREDIVYLYIFKEKFVFLHIKSYNKDIYDHIWCSTALLWQTVPSQKLELIADATASWKWLKIIEVQGHFKCFNSVSTKSLLSKTRISPNV